MNHDYLFQHYVRNIHDIQIFFLTIYSISKIALSMKITTLLFYWNLVNYHKIANFKDADWWYIIELYDLWGWEKLQFCVQVFTMDIELQELSHTRNKLSVLYCDMTEVEL